MKSAISATAFAGSSAWRNGGHENSAVEMKVINGG
jgi:hypothetical protein